MKDFTYYTCDISYPKKENFTTVYVYNLGNFLGEYTLKEYKNIQKSFPDEHVIQKIFDETAYKEQRNIYHQEVNKKLDEFRHDLFKEFMVENNPKKHRSFNLAWQKGHAGGLSDVYSNFSELVHLIKD